jgi:hypothetical protein
MPNLDLPAKFRADALRSLREALRHAQQVEGFATLPDLAKDKQVQAAADDAWESLCPSMYFTNL